MTAIGRAAEIARVKSRVKARNLRVGQYMEYLACGIMIMAIGETALGFIDCIQRCSARISEEDPRGQGKNYLADIIIAGPAERTDLIQSDQKRFYEEYCAAVNQDLKDAKIIAEMYASKGPLNWKFMTAAPSMKNATITKDTSDFARFLNEVAQDNEAKQVIRGRARVVLPEPARFLSSF